MQGADDATCERPSLISFSGVRKVVLKWKEAGLQLLVLWSSAANSSKFDQHGSWHETRRTKPHTGLFAYA